MTDMARILVVEDEPVIRSAVCDALEASGFEANPVEDGPEALKRMADDEFNLVILDIMLPGGIDGVEVCRQIRANGNHVPVLMLTAKGSEEDRVRGLKVGADDYVAKPFGVKELMARVEALLRRSGWPPPLPPRVCVDETVVHLARLEVQHNGETNVLTPKEADILRYLLRHPDRVVTKQEFLVEVWGYPDVELETRTVENTIVYLRQKIENEPKDPRWILTVRGGGFKLGPDVTWVKEAEEVT